MKILVEGLSRFDGSVEAGRFVMAEMEAQGIAFTVEYTAAEQRDLIRAEIASHAGDTLSVLGTTADAAALSTLGMCALTVAVAQGTSWASFKTAFTDAIASMAGEQDMAALSAAFLAKVASGEVKVPALAKGIDEVIADIEQRSTAVSDALISAAS